MKVLFIIVALILSVRFVIDAQYVGTRKNNWKWFIKTTIDTFLLIAFAILEKGRW